MNEKDLQMEKRDPRINFAVCVGHACEEAMEALQAYDNLEVQLHHLKNSSRPLPAEEVAYVFERALSDFMEETADLIYAVRRLCFYAKAEGKVTDAVISEYIESMSGNYTGFSKEPEVGTFQIAVTTALYSHRVLRILGVGYPSRHSFEVEFPKFLDRLREVLRLLIVHEIKGQLVPAGHFEDDEWKAVLERWIDFKKARKEKADLEEGHDYYAGGY